MTHSYTDKSRWIVGLLCVVALVSGCQADKDGQRELLINELRLHEDTIYDLEADLDEADRRLDATRRENTILKQEIATLQTQIPQPKKDNSTNRLRNKIFGDPVLNPSQDQPDEPLVDAPPFPKTDAAPKTDSSAPDNAPLNPQPVPAPGPNIEIPQHEELTPGKKLKFRSTSHRTTSFKPMLTESNAGESIANKESPEALRDYFSKKPIARTELDDATALVQNDSLKYRRAIQNDAPPVQSDTSQNHFVQSDAEPAQPMMRSVMQRNSVMQDDASSSNPPQRQLREPQRLPQSRTQNLRPLQQSQPQQRTTRTSHNQTPGQNAGSIPAPLDGALGNTPPAIKASASAVHHITINPRLTGGHNADHKPGDEGIMVVFSPQDDQNRPLFVQGDISVVLLDTKLQARSARWDYSSDEAVKFFRKSVFGGEAYHLELRWPNLPPLNPQQEVFIRFTTGTGQKFEASRICSVEARIEGEVPNFATQNPIAANPGAQPSHQNSSDVAPPAFNINIPEVAQSNQFNPSSAPSHSNSSSRDRLSRRSGLGQRFAGSRSSRSIQSQPMPDGSIDPNSAVDVQIDGMPNGGSTANQPLYANGVRNNASSGAGSTWWNPLSWFSKSESNASNAPNAQSSAPIYQNGYSSTPQNGFAIVPLDGHGSPNVNAVGPTIASIPTNNNAATGNSTNDSVAPRWSGNVPSATIIPSSNAFQAPQMAEKPEWRPYR